MNLLRRIRASSPCGASSDTISLLRKGKTSKPDFVRGTAPLSAAFAASFPDGQVKPFAVILVDIIIII